MTDLELRPIPTSDLSPAGVCEGCGRDIVWTITVAGPNGRGGKAMPVDPLEDLAGNVAVRPTHGRRLTSRVLARDELVDRPQEYSAMTHFASCPAGAHPSPPERSTKLPPRRNHRRARAGR